VRLDDIEPLTAVYEHAIAALLVRTGVPPTTRTA
jgi:hypothetical protein